MKYSKSETCPNLQPFFSLQLDIQSPTVNSVMDALREYFCSAELENSSSNGLGDQQQQQQLSSNNSLVEHEPSSRFLTLSLEELPAVLILHLKRMLFDGNTGGCVKVNIHVIKWF